MNARNRFTKLLIAAVAALLLVTTIGVAKELIDPTGNTYDLTGKLGGKVLGERVRGPGSGELRFGPDWDLTAGSFSLPLDDGHTVIEVRGTFGVDSRGKHFFTPDTAALEDELEDLFDYVLDAYFAKKVPGATWRLVVSKAKLKIKFRSKKGVETAKVRLKFSFITSAQSGSKSKSVKTKISYKASGPLSN